MQTNNQLRGVERIIPIKLVPDHQKYLLRSDHVNENLEKNRFRPGNEIQRVSVLQNLPDLVKTGQNDQKFTADFTFENGQCFAAKNQPKIDNANLLALVDVDRLAKSDEKDADRLLRILPDVQETLNCGSACLDLHFEASQAYKDILAQSSKTDLNLCSQILHGILQNLDAQESARSAWLETLLDIIAHLPSDLIHSVMLPLINAKSQQLNDCVSRLIAGKLLGRVAYKLDPSEVKIHIVPLVQSLSQDLDAAIRASVSQQLAIIAYSLSLSDLKSVVLPLIIDFCKDEDEFVREATLETIVSLLSLFDDESCNQVLIPLCKRFIAEILTQNNPKTLTALSRCFAALYKSIKRLLDDQEQNWFLFQFCKLCALGSEENTKDTENGNRQDYLTYKQSNIQATFQTCRENAAFSFPMITESVSVEKFSKNLLPAYKKLCQDPETEIRRNMASGFHSMVKFLEKQCHLLYDSFVDLIYSGESEVIAALTLNLGSILKLLYQMDQQNNDENGNLHLKDSKSLSCQLTRILLACNRLIRNCSNWRCHEKYLQALGCVQNCVSKSVLISSFLPMVKEEVFNTRALPCRIAALTTLLTWAENRENSDECLVNIMNFFNTSVIKHKSCHKRTLYLDACQLALTHWPIEVFKENFLQGALSLANDPVLNIRLKLCKLLPLVKKVLEHDPDPSIVSSMDFAIQTMLEKNVPVNRYTEEVMKTVVSELSTNRKKESVKNEVIPIIIYPMTSLHKPADSSSSKPTSGRILESAKSSEPEQMDKKFEKRRENQSSINFRKNDEKPANIDDIVTSSKIPTTKNSQISSREGKWENFDDETFASCNAKFNEEKLPHEIDKKEENAHPVEKSPAPSSDPGPPESAAITKPKKMAIIKPRQMVVRSPSPRPSFSAPNPTGQSEKFEKMKKAEEFDQLISTQPKHRVTRVDVANLRPAPYFSSTLPLRSSYGSKNISSYANERLVPIKLVHSSSSSSIHAPLHAGAKGDPPSVRRHSSSMKPPLPLSGSHHREIEISKRENKKPPARGFEPPTSKHQRSIPVVRTGSVQKSVAQFESAGSGQGASILQNTATSRFGLGYPKSMNRSFASFSSYCPTSRALDREFQKDFNGTIQQNSRKGSFSPFLMTQSIDRPFFGLTRVRSGSSIQASNHPSYISTKNQK